MLTQLSVLGRTSRRGANSKLARRTLHSDVAVGAKAGKSGNAKARLEGEITSTFTELLDDQAASYPHKDTYASAVEDLKWTTQQLIWHTTGIAGSLHSFASKARTAYTSEGVLRGEFLVGLLAAPRAGKLFAVVPTFDAENLIAQLQQSNTQFLLFYPKVGKKVQLDDIHNVFPHVPATPRLSGTPFTDKRVPEMRGIVHTAKRTFDGMINHIDFQAPHYPAELFKRGHGPIAAEDVSTLIWENGAFEALSQYNLLNTANLVGEALGITSANNSLVGVSPSSAAGITAGLLMPLVRRSKIVVPADVPSQNVSKIHEAIAQQGVSAVVADSETWTAILRESQPAQVKAFASAVKKAVIVGDNAAVNPEIIKAISSTLGVATVHTTQGTAQSAGVALVDGKPIAGSEVKVDAGFLSVKGVNASHGSFNAGKVSSHGKDGWVQTKIKAKQSSDNSFTVSN